MAIERFKSTRISPKMGCCEMKGSADRVKKRCISSKDEEH